MAELESTLDISFISTQYGILRILQAGLCIVTLLLEETSKCYTRDYSLIELATSFGLVFSVLVFIMFLIRFNEICENHINLPLSLMINETIGAILLLLGSIVVLFHLCAGGLKVGGILTGIVGIITCVTFAASARLSYAWFATGSQSMVA